jgi:hypothetical protein
MYLVVCTYLTTDHSLLICLLLPPFSELRIFGRSRESDHVTDIAHAGYKLHHPFEAQTEARMGHGPETTRVEIPP